MSTRFKSVIESTLDRKVIAYLSQVNMEPEVSVEIFILEPGDDGEEAVFEYQETD
jgi:hypothetical protein